MFTHGDMCVYVPEILRRKKSEGPLLSAFSISPCSETPEANCDLIIPLHSKSLEKCHKIEGF